MRRLPARLWPMLAFAMARPAAALTGSGARAPLPARARAAPRCVAASNGVPGGGISPDTPPSLFPALPPVGETVRQIEPQRVQVRPWELSPNAPLPVPPLSDDATFVQLFRECAPYIKMHQGKTMVFHVDSEVLEDDDIFSPLMEEIAVLALLGVRPVLLIGTRRQVDLSLTQRGVEPVYHRGVRVSDEVTMRVVQEVSGIARSRVEGALARGRSRSGPRGGVGVDVVGGNFFYTAQPVGVRDGVDHGFTGEVRSVDEGKLRQHLREGEIVLMTALGYSASGAIFNVKTELLAARTASALGASKLIYLTPARLMQRRSTDLTGRSPVLQSLRLGEAKTLIEHYRRRAASAALAPTAAGQPDGEQEGEATESPGVMRPVSMTQHMVELTKHCVSALEAGVTRTHLLPPAPGALIQELYTTDGIGTLISRDLYDGIRLATPADVPAILELIEPLEDSGVLIKRPREALARDVHEGFYYVNTRDDTLLSCAQLKRYSPTCAEIGCLVVASVYRSKGRGDAMLSFLERTAVAAGVEEIFCLSTRTMQWFVERGFAQVPLSSLPARRAAMYDPARNSKVYMKGLGSARQIDAEELFWNMDFGDSGRGVARPGRGGLGRGRGSGR